MAKRIVDEIGRVVLPEEMRANMDIKIGSVVDLAYKEDKIIITNDEFTCKLCGSKEELINTACGYVCETCARAIQAAMK